MSQWLDEVIEQAAAPTDFLKTEREQSLLTLQQAGWPGRRNEAWRFTPLTSLAKRSTKSVSSAGDKAVPQIDGLNSIDVTFVDGQLTTDVAALSLPDGVTVTPFDKLSDDQQHAVATLYGKIKPTHHVFGLVNDVASSQGLFVDVAEGVTMEQVLRVSNLITQDVDAHTRLVVRVGKNAKARVMEHGEGQVSSMSTAFAEYAIADGGHLEHYRFAMMTGAAKQVGGSHFKLGNESTMHSTLVGYGSELSRLDVDIIHAGEHADAKMNAVYLLAEGELFDLHSNIEHTLPNGTTEENARGIIGDRARAVFNGRIHIHRDAQKTLAELNNRNLLLSRRGLINTKPELEIYADDVKCAHGATVAEIDDDALFYLLTRGVSRSKALVMLNFGFIQELVNLIPEATIRDWLLPKLSERFAQMEVK